MITHGLTLVIFILSGAVSSVVQTTTTEAVHAPVAATGSGLYPIHRSQENPLTVGLPTCSRIEFTVDKNGKPRDFHVWAHYLLTYYGYKVGQNWLTPNRLDRYTFKKLDRWKFHPRMKNGESVSTSHVIYTIAYTSGFHAFNFTDGLLWLCTLPPMHGVPIHAVTPSATISAAPTILAYNAENGREISLGPAYVVVNAASIPRSTRPQTLWLKFCVNAAGQPSNVMLIHGENGAYALAARHALEQIRFPVPMFINQNSVPACGLVVRVHFKGQKSMRNHEIGLVGPIRLFGKLIQPSSEPKLEKQNTTRISVNIPPGTKLPPVAKVQVRFCIDLDGRVSEAKVVNADPPQVFDRAAIETVENWRFKRPPARMCDVYERVRFPLGRR